MSSRLLFSQRNRRIIFVALGLTATSAILAGLLARSSEPSYHGHRLSSWAKVIAPNNAQTFGPDCTAREAPDAFRSMGTNTLPYLVEWMSYNGGPTPGRNAVNWGIAKCPRLGKIKALRDWARFDTKYIRGDGAFIAFMFLRETGSPAIPNLLKLATKPGYTISHQRAVYALANIGPPALNALDSIATNRAVNGDFRSAAIGCVGYFGGRAEFAIPDLTAALQDTNSCVASSAADALGRLRIRADLAVPALIVAATHPGVAGESAISALTEFGPQACEAIAALREIARSNDRFRSRHAASAIARIEGRSRFGTYAEMGQQRPTNAPAH